MTDDRYQLKDAAALQAIIGEPMEFVRAKVMDRLNEAMADFIAASPIAFVSTIDENGHVDVSPKGDPAGFVTVQDDQILLIPERLGNKLTFGFHNILRNGEIGLIFLVPGQRETLRVKGTATIHNDPAILEAMAVKGKPAICYTRVAISDCFFHCGKAMIRSHLWQPDKWPESCKSIAATQMAGHAKPDAERIKQTEAALDHSYREELY